ncbi:MAG TPA: hypothetical protein VN628_13370, partial [Vicinamibacterales bacterium]|nr:hypothetical protein [Vicinamibacterales bacterium]
QEVSQPLAGDVQLVARVTAVENTNTYAKAGIMLRDSTAAGAAHVILDVRPNGNVEFMTRSTANGQTTWLASTTQTTPVWLKLTRSGSTVTGYVSVNGTTWTPVGVASLTFGPSPIGALVVTAHDVTQLNTSTFDNVSAGALPVVIPPPAAPSSPSPVNSAANTASGSVAMAWTAAGATSYDVRFGTTNPPVQVASGIATAAYTASGLLQGTTYYWQIVARNSSGTTAGPVWSFSTQPPPPSVPSNSSPVSGATGLSSGPLALGWSSSGATSYDVYFGATNPPALAASNVATSSYAVASLQAGTSYFWQVVAKNTTGSTAGPVWSFATQVAPPSMPSSPAPVSGASGTSSTLALSWTAAGSTAYDVYFGATNPPALVAAGVSAATYPVSALQAGTSYYWQVVAKNAGGTTPGPVWSFATQVAPPSMPSSPAPVSGASGTSSTLALSWTAAGSTAYDVYFGATNPPALAAAGVSTATYPVSTLQAGTSYYWQVVAKNVGGTTPGPVWSFATQVAAPASPSSPSPTSGATGVDGSSVTLTWAADGATSYDVLFGTTNPPAQVASSISAAQYSPSALQQNTTYYWQVVARNAGGTTTGDVWSFVTDPPPVSNTDNIVVYASDIPASALHGVWSSATDATSPSGVKLVTPVHTPNLTGGALASPNDYVDVTFNANAGVPYTLWLRIEGTGNSKNTDSIYVQFSDALAGGAPIYPIGTTQALTVNLSTDVTASSDKQWGWVNGAYWLSQPATVTFAGSGQHTLRIQVREYGVMLDQIVLSPVQYFNASASCPTACAGAPGPVTNDATIVSKTTSTAGSNGSGGGTTPPQPPPPPPPPSSGGTTTTTGSTGVVWNVPAGGDLQAALNAAQPGDVIQLQAGATYTGNFVLPAKSPAATAYITITSSGSGLPDATTRINPGYAPLLAKIQSPNSAPALATVPYAHHYQLVNLEFLANYQGYNDVIDFGDGSSAQNSLAGVPHDLVADRLYIHGDPVYGQKRAIGLNSASTTVKNSYIASIMAVGQDAQALCGWNGPGPFTIDNNYLEASTENVLFGGADPAIPQLVPSDITITRNYIAKQPSWMGGPWQVKNLLELKNAQRVVIDGNTLEYNWLNAQSGASVLFTVRDQDGTAPWSVVQHVQFTNNVVRHVSSVFNILG